MDFSSFQEVMDSMGVQESERDRVMEEYRDIVSQTIFDDRTNTAKDGWQDKISPQIPPMSPNNPGGIDPNNPPLPDKLVDPPGNNDGRSTFQIPPSNGEILQRLARIEQKLNRLLEEEKVTESSMKPPEVEDVPDSVPEEWLEDLETEEPPSPERLRKLAGMMARNADFDGEVEVPAREFVRVLLMLADMKQQEAMSAVDWNQLEPEGPHRDVGITVDYEASVCRVTIDVPLHIMSYGGATTARHVRQRFSSALGALRKITKMEGRADVEFEDFARDHA